MSLSTRFLQGFNSARDAYLFVFSKVVPRLYLPTDDDGLITLHGHSSLFFPDAVRQVCYGIPPANGQSRLAFPEDSEALTTPASPFCQRCLLWIYFWLPSFCECTGPLSIEGDVVHRSGQNLEVWWWKAVRRTDKIWRFWGKAVRQSGQKLAAGAQRCGINSSLGGDALFGHCVRLSGVTNGPKDRFSI